MMVMVKIGVKGIVLLLLRVRLEPEKEPRRLKSAVLDYVSDQSTESTVVSEHNLKYYVVV